MKITKDMSIGEVVELCPDAVDVLMEYGLHCVGCGAAMWETLEEGAMGHGMSSDIFRIHAQWILMKFLTMKKIMKICLPLRESSQPKIIEIFETHKNDCDLFEVWLDAVQDLDIPSLIQACPKPLLCVCKAEEEKGDFLGSEEERIDVLIQASKAGANFIDIGIHTDKKLIENAQKEWGIQS